MLQKRKTVLAGLGEAVDYICQYSTDEFVRSFDQSHDESVILTDTARESLSELSSLLVGDIRRISEAAFVNMSRNKGYGDLIDDLEKREIVAKALDNEQKRGLKIREDINKILEENKNTNEKEGDEKQNYEEDFVEERQSSADKDQEDDNEEEVEEEEAAPKSKSRVDNEDSEVTNKFNDEIEQDEDNS
ncbi:MAG: hypothetical protein EZS28_023957 [Streblomastix strix]|uniref:Uncharacterized protein n=1 Tax=Streblomastix strix TaxID=222440 RepID=A0A5J4VD89_9EUKA|nr:MAG: hypothetical protein EZS28_023957 [Streblomastix strix]